MPSVFSAIAGRGRCAWLALICALLPAPLGAQTPATQPPRQLLTLRNLAVLRWNPIGLIDDARLQYRYRLYDGETPLGRDNFVGVATSAAAGVNLLRYGVTVEAQPLSVWGVWASLEGEHYWGTWQTLQSFASATQDFRDSTLAERGRDGQHYATRGSQLTLGTQLQARLGPLAARSQGRLARVDMQLRPGDRVFYSPIHDLMLGSRGWFVSADTDVVWRGGGWTVGLRWSVAQALYQASHLAPGEDLSATPGLSQRVGPMLQYASAKQAGRGDHSVTLVTGWWLDSPTRLGQDPLRPRSVPYLALAYSWATELFSRP